MQDARLVALKALHWITRSTASAYHYFDAFTSELMVAAVPREYWHELTVSLYSDNRLLYSVHHHERLFDWERRVIESHFPPAPARILVGACGSGREMAQLARRGFDVAGFDPSLAGLKRARARIDRSRLLALRPGTYEELARGDMTEIEGEAPYDAVLLGWGSLGHVADPAVRQALFGRLRTLCPAGPVLCSWIRKPPEGPHRTRLRALLRAVGLERQSESDAFRALVGFYSALDAADIEQLARAADLEIVELGDQGPYALLAPRTG